MSKYLIGIDEVGRGPLAGPVAVGAFLFLKPEARKLFKRVKESKQLSEVQREEWFKKIEETKVKGLVDFSVVFQSEKIIDKRGISFAIKKCIEKCLKDLKLNCGECSVLLDGGLRAPAEYLDQKTIIKGDVKEQVIALASICAKVLRDRKMKKYAKKYPGYGFEVHKGYGTKLHREMIVKSGMLSLHRVSYCKNIPTILPKSTK